MNIELELGETYAEWKNEAELTWLWRFQTLAEDNSNCSKGCEGSVFTKSEHKLGFGAP